MRSLIGKCEKQKINLLLSWRKEKTGIQMKKNLLLEKLAPTKNHKNLRSKSNLSYAVRSGKPLRSRTIEHFRARSLLAHASCKREAFWTYSLMHLRLWLKQSITTSHLKHYSTAQFGKSTSE